MRSLGLRTRFGSKWLQFCFGESRYEYQSLGRDFDFSPICEYFNFFVCRKRQKSDLKWPLTGEKQHFILFLQIVDIHKNFLQTENGPICTILI